MEKLAIDLDYLKDVMLRLLAVPSPSGYTDMAVHFACDELESLGIPFELTRRGAIRADIKGNGDNPHRAIVAHLDTLGAIVKNLKDNGRLEIAPVGTWAARAAERTRVTIFSDDEKIYRGTILPLKASGHTFNDEVDTQPAAWDNLEIRVDEISHDPTDLRELGINVGDVVALDPSPEVTSSGFIVSRFLDDKAGVAAAFAAIKAVREASAELPVNCHLLLTISEEVGVGASHVLHGDVSELVTIDNGTLAQGQNTNELGVTIAMQDSSGPFDWHLTHKLIDLCRGNNVGYSRDVFRYYRSDAASAVEAGNDIRAALVCFGLDASHGYERVHMDSLEAAAQLLALYMQSPATVARDREALGPINGFPDQPIQKTATIELPED